MVHPALGLCSAILYITNCPNQLIHCHFQQEQRGESPRFVKIQQDLITGKEITSTEALQFIPSNENKVESQWLITERQKSGLSRARVNYWIHRLCQVWLPHLNIRNSNDWIEGYKQIERLVNLSFQSNVTTAHLIETFVNLYFEHHHGWKRSETKMLEILNNNRSEHEKLENIANVLIENER
ncbi:hypothetical protein [Actinobacillus capsulatus]|uniref:hypothetical protein n=1 Tax=Actinobacillus capsulatus TaxID=717 RepID=UPI00037CDF82|nr:hypothetical protein [Actinobacillus capsulatus]